MRNPDFVLLVEAMKQRRLKLFEQGEADDELRAIFEKRGKRKMLEFLCTEDGVSDLFVGMKK